MPTSATPKESSDLLRRVAEKNPSLRTLTALVGQYEQLRDYAMAAETLKRHARDLRPTNIEVKRAYAQNLMMADRPNEALKVYSEITAEDKKDWQSWLRVAQIYRARQAVREGSRGSKSGEGSKVDPNNLEVRYNEVNLLEAEGKSDEAIAVLNDGLANVHRAQDKLQHRRARQPCSSSSSGSA